MEEKEEKIKKSKYLTITAVLCLGLAFNLLSWESLEIGVAFGLAYLLFYSFIAGSIVSAKKNQQIILGLLLLLSTITVATAAAIYFYKLNNFVYILLIFLIPALLITPYYRTNLKEKLSFRKALKKYLDKFSKRQETKINLILIIAYLFLTSFAFLLLFESQTSQSIQSPWQVIPSRFFLFYFLASAVLLTYLFQSIRTKLALTLIIIHTFLSTSVALIVYTIGYGFDPFIHRATEQIIAQKGTISPTPLYYLGQYGLIIFLSKLTLINFSIIDRILVPVLTAIILPPSIFYVLSHWLKKNYALVLALLILVVPYSSFIMTAPQNLANLFFIITIFLSLLYYRNQINVWLLYLLALATLAIHPLAGIPLIITVFLLNLFKLMYKSYIKYISLYFLTASVFIFAMPLAFIASGSKFGLSLPAFQPSNLALLGWIDKFDLPLNLAYLVDLNQAVLAGVIIIAGLVYLAKNKLLKNNSPYLISALIIFINYLITKYFLTFPNLRDFDTPDFVNRLLLLTFYILLPFFLLGLYWLIKKFWEKDLLAKTFLIFILTGALSISVYLSYPRLDQYQGAKFFSLGAADIKAVQLIEQTADPAHIVLANQMVGAAAIQEFGFKRYFNQQFYYSMPIGSPRTFYDYYLEMIYQGATKQTALNALSEAGVNEVYFVLNKYWRNAEKIAAQARQQADQTFEIDDGEVYIFKYKIAN